MHCVLLRNLVLVVVLVLESKALYLQLMFSVKNCFLRGGLELRVTGTNLDAVQNAKILFKYPSENGALSNTTVQVRASVLYHHIVIFHCLVIVIS